MTNIVLTQSEHGISPSTIYNVEITRHGTVYGNGVKTTAQVSSGANLIYVETPTVTPSANSIGLTEHQVITGSAYSVTDGTNSYTSQLPHVSTDWKIYEVKNDVETLVEQSLADTNNLTSYTMTNNLEVSKSYRFKAVYHAGSIKSSESVANGTTPEIFTFVTTPGITINGWDRELPTLTGSAYHVMEGSADVTASYPHTYTNWRCYKIENGVETIVWSSLNDTTNLTSITLTTALDESINYRFECEYGNTSFVSDTGALIGTTAATFKTEAELWLESEYGISDTSNLPGYTAGTNLIKTEHGRILYRHSNDKGTVVVFDMYDIKTVMFVADAQYRITCLFGGSGTDSSNPNFNTTNADGNWSAFGSKSGYSKNSAFPFTMSDAELQTLWSNLSSDKTARENCDVWMTISDCTGTDRTVGYCRSLTSFDGIDKCDCPNFYEDLVLFFESDNLDNLDPTGSSYSNFKFGCTNPGGRFCANGTDIFKSCTEYDANGLLFININANCYDGPGASKNSYTRGVAPISELGFFANGTLYSDYDEAKQAAKIAEMKANAPAKLTELGITASDLPGYANDDSLMLTPSGRLIYRHTNGKGSVLVYDRFGITECLFIADAEYRSRAASCLSTSSIDLSLTNLNPYYNTSETNRLYNSNGEYVSGSSSNCDTRSYETIGAVTDAQLQRRFYPLTAETSARIQCDTWLAEDSDAASSGRSIPIARALTNIINGGCDVPLAYQCWLFYIEGDYIDQLDPTLTDYPNNNLGYTNGVTRIFNDNQMCCCSEYSSTQSFYIGSANDMLVTNKSYNYSLVPIKEIGFFNDGYFYTDYPDVVALKKSQEYIDNLILSESAFSSTFNTVNDLPGYTADGSFAKTTSGRLIYRHSNGYGSVIIFDRFGKTDAVFFADARYRSRMNAALSDNPATPSITGVGTIDKFIYGSDVSTSSSLSSYTDSQIQSDFSDLDVETTAKSQCDLWLSSVSSATASDRAIPAARSLTGIFSGGCEVPLGYQLIVAYVEADYLDDLDPTVSSYADNALGMYSSNSGRWFNGQIVWSCDPSTTNHWALCIYSSSRVYTEKGKQETYSVLPIKELL